MTGRPSKTTVDYFPHYTTSGKTIFTLESLYGNDGYAFWFKLLEILGCTENHYFRYDNKADWLFLVAKTKVTEEKASEILSTLADLGAIDPVLYKEKVVWSDNFVDGLRPVYDKRSTEMPIKPTIRGEKRLSVEKTPQSKVKERKVEKSKEENIYSRVNPDYRKIIDDLNEKCGTKFRHTSKKTKSLIKARLNDGFSVDDFFIVHTKKANDWKFDQKMRKFLRPETLYSNKFEGYLNQPEMPHVLSRAGIQTAETLKTMELS